MAELERLMGELTWRGIVRHSGFLNRSCMAGAAAAGREGWRDCGAAEKWLLLVLSAVCSAYKGQHVAKLLVDFPNRAPTYYAIISGGGNTDRVREIA